jgi:hypothetical protein
MKLLIKPFRLIHKIVKTSIFLNYQLNLKELFQPTPKILKFLPKHILLVTFCRKNLSAGSYRSWDYLPDFYWIPSNFINSSTFFDTTSKEESK